MKWGKKSATTEKINSKWTNGQERAQNEVGKRRRANKNNWTLVRAKKVEKIFDQKSSQAKQNNGEKNLKKMGIANEMKDMRIILFFFFLY